MPDHYNLHRRKALSALAGAESEFAARRYDNAVNRAYYYCFHMAVAARIADGQPPDQGTGRWRHGLTIQALDELIVRWSEPSEFVGLMGRVYAKRVRADYELLTIAEDEAAETISQARQLGGTIERHVVFRGA